MPDISFDFGNADPVLPEEGWYRLEVLDGEETAPTIALNKSGDGYNIVMQYQIVDCTDEESEGHKIRNWASLKQKSLWSTKAMLEALFQQDFDDAMDFEELELLVEQMPGKTVLALCGHNTYQGRTNLQIKNFVADNEEFVGEGGVFFR